MKALILALLAGCAVPQTDCRTTDTIEVVEGICVEAPSTVEFPIVDTAPLARQTERALSLAARVWGLEPGALTGWTVRYQRGWLACGTTWTYGCAFPAARLIVAAPGPSGCAAGVLIHEVGHALIGDMAHADPRWTEADALESQPCEPK